MLMEFDEVMIFVHWLSLLLSPSTVLSLIYCLPMDTDMAFLREPAS